MSPKKPVYSSRERPAPSQAQSRLHTGRSHDRAARLENAIVAYREAIQLAEAPAAPRADRAVLIEALRRLGVIHHRKNQMDQARALCRQSFREAVALGDSELAGEALNALGGFDMETGDLAAARALYRTALPLADSAAGLLGRIEQNLGIVASIQGDHDDAFEHYHRSLDAFQRAGDEAGAAIAYHNLGLIGARRGELDQAEQWFAMSAARAAQSGDVYLEGLCEMSRAEVAYRRERYSLALQRAEAALEIFERIGVRQGQSSAYRRIGVILRDTGRVALAEDRLRTALAIARETGSLLDQAEAARELSKLHHGAGQKREARAFLDVARGLFQRLEARVDLEDINRRLLELAA